MSTHEWLHICVCAGCRDPLELSHLRRDLRRKRYFEFRSFSENDLSYTLFVRIVSVAVQKSNGYTLDFLLKQMWDKRPDLVFI